MGSVNILKRGKVYQYSFDVGKINGKRKRITKSEFYTKQEAINKGNQAYNEYLTAGVPYKENPSPFNFILEV